MLAANILGFSGYQVPAIGEGRMSGAVMFLL